MKRLADRVVVITGASAGIGRATAERCAAEGAAVVLSARRVDRLHEIVAAIIAAGGRALAVPGDVTREADMDALVARAVDAFGRLDVMICNAGIGYHGPLDETPPGAMRRLVDVNLMGTLYAAHAAMRAFRRQGRGHIIAVSSIVGRRGVGGSSVYAATKAGQLAFIESLRAEFVGTPFRASVVFPVVTTTEFHETIARDFGHEVSGSGPRQSADHVAKTIANCIVSPKAEVYPFPKAWWLAVLSVLAPAQADRVVQKFGRRRKPIRPAHDAEPQA
ncbi:MAG: SDR family NAD(P)-dependent oxidoreductase [Vicinamibacterales bacterium]